MIAFRPLQTVCSDGRSFTSRDHPKHRSGDGRNRRQRRQRHTRFVSTEDCPEVPSFRNNIPQQDKGPFLAGKKCPPRAAALPYLPTQNLPLTNSGNTLLNFLASLTPFIGSLLSLCITQSAPNYPWVVYPGG